MAMNINNRISNPFLLVKFPFSISHFQEIEDTICNLSMGLSLEDIIVDSIFIYIGKYTLEEWLFHVESTIWKDHVPNDSYLEVKSFCEHVIVELLALYHQKGLIKVTPDSVTNIDIDFKATHIEIKFYQ